MNTTETMETRENEVVEVEAMDVVNEIEAENSGKGIWIIGGVVAAVGAGYMLVKKVVIPRAKKIKAKLEAKKAEKNTRVDVYVGDGELETKK